MSNIYAYIVFLSIAGKFQHPVVKDWVSELNKRRKEFLQDNGKLAKAAKSDSDTKDS